MKKGTAVKILLTYLRHPVLNIESKYRSKKYGKALWYSYAVFRDRVRWSKNLVARPDAEAVEDVRKAGRLVACCGATYLELPKSALKTLWRRGKFIGPSDIAETYRVEYLWEVFLVPYGTKEFVPAKSVLSEEDIEELRRMKARLYELVGRQANRPIYVAVLKDGTVVY